MGKGLIGGILGGVSGFGDAMTEISKEKLHQLAEKLKMDMMEQKNIRQEGRLEAQHKREKEFENKMPLSASDAERLRREEAARSRENEYQAAEKFAEDERGHAYDKENAKTKHGYEMAQIGEQGRWNEKVANIRASGSEDSIAAQKLKDQRKKEAEENFRRELAAVAEENGIPIESIYNPDLKETTLSGMVTKAELKKLNEIAGGSGFKVRAAKTDDTRDREGLLTGDDELYKIIGVFSSGAKSTDTASPTSQKSETESGKSAQSWIKSAVDEVTRPNETTGEKSTASAPTTDPASPTQKPGGFISDALTPKGALSGREGLQKEMKIINDMASKVGVAPENWKAAAKLVGTVGKGVWDMWANAVSAVYNIPRAAVEAQRQAIKESGY